MLLNPLVENVITAALEEKLQLAKWDSQQDKHEFHTFSDKIRHFGSAPGLQNISCLAVAYRDGNLVCPNMVNNFVFPQIGTSGLAPTSSVTLTH